MTRRAIQLALQLAQKPWLARELRSEPLPDDILDLIKLVAGCRETCREMESVTARPPEVLRVAAAHYLYVALFFSGAPPERVLGLRRGASHETMLQHKRWLLKWLHPDRNTDAWETGHMRRVLTAWNELRDDQSSEYERLNALIDVQTAPLSNGSASSPTASVSAGEVAPRNSLNARVPRRGGIAIMIVSALTITGIGVILALAGDSAWQVLELYALDTTQARMSFTLKRSTETVTTDDRDSRGPSITSE